MPLLWQEDMASTILSLLSRICAQNLRTSIVLVKGLDFGKVLVTARLTESGYKGILDTVELSVLEPFQLSPTLPIFIAPDAEVLFTLQSYPRDRDPTSTFQRVVAVAAWLVLITGQQKSTCPMPSTCGLLKILKSLLWITSASCVQLTLGKPKYMFATKTLTRLRFVLFARHVDTTTDLFLRILPPQAVVNVVAPSKLGIRLYLEADKEQEIISSANYWYLISNTTYLLDIEVYDANDRRLYTTEAI